MRDSPFDALGVDIVQWPIYRTVLAFRRGFMSVRVETQARTGARWKDWWPPFEETDRLPREWRIEWH